MAACSRFVTSAVVALGATALGAPALAAQPMSAPPGAPPVPAWAEVVAVGLANPRGLSFGDDGALYIAEAGIGGDGPCAMGPEGNEECFGTSGGVTRVADGTQEQIVSGLASRAAEGGMNASGPADVAQVGDALYVLVGYGGDPTARDPEHGGDQYGFLLRVDGGDVTSVADVAGYEADNNPDGGLVDSNPFSLEVAADGSAVIGDAGANAILALDAAGEMSTLAVFPDIPAKTADGSTLETNAVPTGFDIAQDGTIYVGQLTGFPFPQGGASVLTVPAGGGDPAVAHEGFTNVIDVAVAPDGTVYVLQFTRNGILGIDPSDPSTMEGQLTAIAPDGTQTVVADEGLVLPTGLAIDADGTPYVAVFGVAGDAGQVWKIVG